MHHNETKSLSRLLLCFHCPLRSPRVHLMYPPHRYDVEQRQECCSVVYTNVTTMKQTWFYSVKKNIVARSMPFVCKATRNLGTNCTFWYARRLTLIWLDSTNSSPAAGRLDCTLRIGTWRIHQVGYPSCPKHTAHLIGLAEGAKNWTCKRPI